MNTDHCLLEREGHVLIVTLNRPEAKNALSSGMLAGMYKAWRMLDDDPELRDLGREDRVIAVRSVDPAAPHPAGSPAPHLPAGPG